MIQQTCLTVKQLSLRWNIPVSTIRLLIKSGRLKYFKIGKHFRFERSQIEHYERGNANCDDFKR